MQLEADNAALKERFAALTSGIPQIVWTSRDHGDWTWSSPRWTAYTGLSVEASKGLGWVDAIHPEDRVPFAAAWRKALDCGVLDVEHRVMATDRSAAARWFRTFSMPLPDQPGHSREWLGICTDVHDTRLVEEQQWTQVGRLQRRVCNVLALTRSVSRRTAKASATVEEYALHLDNRLDAIARTQNMLLRDIDAGVHLEHLVLDGLLAYAAHEGEQVQVRGPSVPLRGKLVELLGLAVNELAMNAVEHGALATPHGRLLVSWRLEQVSAGAVLHFEWLETGVPMLNGQARHKGFGTELIEITLEHELGAAASLDMCPEGIRCTVRLPLPEEAAIPPGHP